MIFTPKNIIKHNNNGILLVLILKISNSIKKLLIIKRTFPSIVIKHLRERLLHSFNIAYKIIYVNTKNIYINK